MENFILQKMREHSDDLDGSYLDEYDYKILGDNQAFLVYHYMNPQTIWVEFLWASNKKKMLKICRELWAESQETDSIILYDDDGVNLHSTHATQVYLWTKEL